MRRGFSDIAGLKEGGITLPGGAALLHNVIHCKVPLPREWETEGSSEGILSMKVMTAGTGHPDSSSGASLNAMHLYLRRLYSKCSCSRRLGGSLLGVCIFLGAFLGATPAFVWAGQADAIQELREVLRRIVPGQAPDAVEASPVPGLYEVRYGTEVFYMTAGGRYVLQGDLVDLETRTNLSEEKRSAARLRIMAGIDPATAIVFPAKGARRYVVNVFTDVDCTYCRKMHREIEEYQRRGIEIRYLAYPRSGVNTKSYYRAVSVWCSEDRQEAITFAKSGGKMARRDCPNPVEEHMAKAGEIGITGTPTLVLPDGSVIAGYVPAKQLIRILDERIGGRG